MMSKSPLTFMSNSPCKYTCVDLCQFSHRCIFDSYQLFELNFGRDSAFYFKSSGRDMLKNEKGCRCTTSFSNPYRENLIIHDIDVIARSCREETVTNPAIASVSPSGAPRAHHFIGLPGIVVSADN